ncbi:MAG: DUF721 domain-containing protein [Paramuribaculum sp.]|nr:DUF721 domain-containing protein [Paramuribaculum sp.]
MKRTEPKTFAAIYSEALERAGMTETFARQQASYLWTEIVGPGVNKYTTRRYMANDNLHVYISSASLKNELRFHRAAIIRDINARIGRDILKDIIFH